jgi:hypothetical protein
MLCRATNEIMFNSEFDSARTLGNWVQGRKAYNSNIKKSMSGSFIESRFINQNKEELFTNSDLQNPSKIHGLKSILPKWKNNGEFQY